jgi:hypothetical protein
MKHIFNLVRDGLVFILGILLVVYASLNIAISPAPSNLSEIPSNYGKTFCLPIQTISPTSQEGEKTLRQKTQRAYALVLLAMIGGIFLILISIVGLYRSLIQVEYLSTSSRIQI